MKFSIIAPYAINDQVLESIDSKNTLGIEVTIPKLAAKCGLGNIDHHREGDNSDTPSACEQALNWPYVDCNVIGVLADPDTLTAMAVLWAKVFSVESYACFYSQNGYYPEESGYEVDEELVKKIGLIDRKGPASKPDLLLDPRVKYIRAIAAQRGMDLSDQVYKIMLMLCGKELTADDLKIIEAEELKLIDAEKASKVKMVGDIVIVESPHSMATQIGYKYGDVLICINNTFPKDFKDLSKGTYRKITLCKRDDYVPYNINFSKLNSLENGWGGRPTIGGSPQGVDSTLTIEQILSCIEKI